MTWNSERGDSDIGVNIIAMILIFCFLGLATIKVTINGKQYSVNLGCTCEDVREPPK